MPSPKDISANAYTYDLPDHKIARHSVSPKHNSKMLVYNNGELNESIFKNISSQLNENSLLVFNNTKVLQARMIFEKETGGKIEVFCLQPANSVLWETALTQKGSVEMECLVGGISKWKQGPIEKKIVYKNKPITIWAHYMGDLPECKHIKLTWEDADVSFAEILDTAGETPLPPYLNRKPESADKITYQTYYAEREGSVAAPTAGLHFTKEVFEDLDKKEVHKLFITLHVGAGTFKPIKSDKLADHEMHKEWICIHKDQLKQIIHSQKQIIAVGTTSLRFLETIYWLGILVSKNEALNLQNLHLTQWQPYEYTSELTRREAIQVLLKKMEAEKLEEFYCTTQILIAPGYQFQMADALLTNFHQPGSTLLLLVAAAIGNDWKKIYDYALANDFRFLSYGDCCLLWVRK